MALSEEESGGLRSALDAVGDTPLVELTRAFSGTEGLVLAKLDFLNPGLSREDRVARQVLTDARQVGLLGRHQTVIGTSTDATGVGFALACAIWQHPFVVVVPSSTSAEHNALLTDLGAEVILIDPREDEALTCEAIQQEAASLVRQTGGFLADPHVDPSNFRAHRLFTGTEILRQTEGRFDAFCDLPRTGGTLGGCAAAFAEARLGIRSFLVEHDGPLPEQGRNRTSRPLVDVQRLSGRVTVTPEEVQLELELLARREGLLVGYDSAANLAGARKLLAGPVQGGRIVVVLGDYRVRGARQGRAA